PGRKISGAAADDGVVGKIFAQPDHDFAEIDAARLWCRLVGPGAIIGVGGLSLRAPADFVGRLQAFERGCEGRGRSIDCEMRMVDATKFLRAGMDMHECLEWSR